MLAIILHLFSLSAYLISGQPVVHDAPKARVNQYQVNELPGLDKINSILQPQMYAGHLTLHESNHTNYFFWKFEQKSQNTDNSDGNNKLVIWLNGGPGCSSMDGALMEVGPLRITPEGEVYFNNGTWLESASMVFLDQPVGTGFSYGDQYHNELTDISFDFLIFLEKYFELFPADLKKELYIAGESYAGQFMPYFAKYILDYNEDPSTTTKYNLKGILIGNGWISASYTGLSYIPFALESGIITGKEEFMSRVYSKQEACQNGLNTITKDSSQEAKNTVDHKCDAILTTLLDVLHQHSDTSECINMYDVRLMDSFPSCGMNWPPDINYLYPFLSDESIQRDLNLNEEYFEKQASDPHNPNKGGTYWQECNTRVGITLVNEKSSSSEEILPEVLSKLPVLLFNGDKDIICNYIGTENFIHDLTWNGYRGFSERSHSVDWYYNDTAVGKVWHERNLTYVRVYNSSHMVPFDLPDVSRGIFDLMIDNFVTETKQPPAAGNEEEVIVTPVYNVSSSTYYYMHLRNKSRLQFLENYFHFRYLVYLVTIGVILYGLFYYNSKGVSHDTPHSILSRKKQREDTLSAAAVLNGIGLSSRRVGKKKSVQWADLQSNEEDTAGDLEQSGSGADTTNFAPFSQARSADLANGNNEFGEDLGFNPHPSTTNDNNNNSQDKFNSFLNKFGLSRPFKDNVKYHKASNYDIEEEIEMVDHFEGMPSSEREALRGPGNDEFMLGEDDADFEVSDEDDLAYGGNRK
ncbi:serine-type carboxypeptidase [Saccharomycopsis crataegensis]|uniref:Carboxypeptidase n=1 Tax=Saccharomycopsis crataegensis TaxID=43959 RepID=A0AAV5QM55_9ASCO|nr:serine-type carboxypeptidase [Saccharomycopsis crataegensis]